jgi:hypothetical protein
MKFIDWRFGAIEEVGMVEDFLVKLSRKEELIKILELVVVMMIEGESLAIRVLSRDGRGLRGRDVGKPAFDPLGLPSGCSRKEEGSIEARTLSDRN